jgi:hypothetical protein
MYSQRCNRSLLKSCVLSARSNTGPMSIHVIASPHVSLSDTWESFTRAALAFACWRSHARGVGELTQGFPAEHGGETVGMNALICSLSFSFVRLQIFLSPLSASQPSCSHVSLKSAYWNERWKERYDNSLVSSHRP